VDKKLPSEASKFLLTMTSRLTKLFGDVVRYYNAFRGDETIFIDRHAWLEVLKFLKEDQAFAFNYLVDITCVDYMGQKPRFEIVAHLLSFSTMNRLRMKARVPEDDPTIESLSHLWRGANWFEREVYDMFGIVFKNHPDLRRVLLYEEFVGHPLRKDYPLKKSQPLVFLTAPERPEDE